MLQQAMQYADSALNSNQSKQKLQELCINDNQLTFVKSQLENIHIDTQRVEDLNKLLDYCKQNQSQTDMTNTIQSLGVQVKLLLQKIKGYKCLEDEVLNQIVTVLYVTLLKFITQKYTITFDKEDHYEYERLVEFETQMIKLEILQPGQCLGAKIIQIIQKQLSDILKIKKIIGNSKSISVQNIENISTQVQHELQQIDTQCTISQIFQIYTICVLLNLQYKNYKNIQQSMNQFLQISHIDKISAFKQLQNEIQQLIDKTNNSEQLYKIIEDMDMLQTLAGQNILGEQVQLKHFINQKTEQISQQLLNELRNKSYENTLNLQDKQILDLFISDKQKGTLKLFANPLSFQLNSCLQIQSVNQFIQQALKFILSSDRSIEHLKNLYMFTKNEKLNEAIKIIQNITINVKELIAIFRQFSQQLNNQKNFQDSISNVKQINQQILLQQSIDQIYQIYGDSTIKSLKSFGQEVQEGQDSPKQTLKLKRIMQYTIQQIFQICSKNKRLLNSTVNNTTQQYMKLFNNMVNSTIKQIYQQLPLFCYYDDEIKKGTIIVTMEYISNYKGNRSQYQPIQQFCNKQDIKQYQPYYILTQNKSSEAKKYTLSQLIQYYEQVSQNILQRCIDCDQKLQEAISLCQLINSDLTILESCSWNLQNQQINNIQNNITQLAVYVYQSNQYVQDIFAPYLNEVLNNKIQSVLKLILQQNKQQSQKADQKSIDLKNELIQNLRQNYYLINIDVQDKKLITQPSVQQVQDNLVNIVETIGQLVLPQSFYFSEETRKLLENIKYYCVNDSKTLENIQRQFNQAEIIYGQRTLNEIIKKCENDDQLLLQTYKLSKQQVDLMENQQDSQNMLLQIQFSDNYKFCLQEKQVSFTKQIQQQLVIQLSKLLAKIEASQQQLFENNLYLHQDQLQASLQNDILGFLQTVSQVLQQQELYKNNKQIICDISEELQILEASEKVQQIIVNEAKIDQFNDNLNNLLNLSSNKILVDQQIRQNFKLLCEQEQTLKEKVNKYQEDVLKCQTSIYDINYQQEIEQQSQELKKIETQYNDIQPQVYLLNKINPENFMDITQLGKDIQQLQQFLECQINSVCKSIQEYLQVQEEQLSQQICNKQENDIIEIQSKVQKSIQLLNEDVKMVSIYQVIQFHQQKLLKSCQIFQKMANQQVFKHQHWVQLAQKLEVQLNEQNTLIQLFKLIFAQPEEKYKQNFQICEQVLQDAQGQYQIQKYLSEVEQAWQQTYLDFYITERQKLLRGWKTYNDLIEEHLSGLQGLQVSPYYQQFQNQAEEIKDKINKLSEILDIWLQTQKRYVYLDSVFSQNKDVMKRYLGQVAVQQEKASKQFMDLVNQSYQQKLVINLLSIKEFLQNMQKVQKALENTQKALSSFLEQQRAISPRLFFVGDEDLLDMISQSSQDNLTGLQRHWNKMFSGIGQLAIEVDEANKQKLVGILSRQGEQLYFDQQFQNIQEQNGQLKIHSILQSVEKGMKYSVKENIIKCIQQLKKVIDNIQSEKQLDEITEILNQYSVQGIITSLQVIFTHHIDNDPENVYQWISRILKKVTVIELSQKRQQFKSIFVSELTHMRNVAENYQNSTDKEIFLEQQLKYYAIQISTNKDVYQQIDNEQINQQYIQDFQIIARCSGATLNYEFEYHGTDQRIVQTNLTEYIYTITCNALSNNYSIIAAGVAGSGKTESSRCFAQLLARPMLVFNTDENFNEVAVGRILIGACEVGATIIFDEFNRLDENTLSAVSNQLQQIQNGLKQKKTEIPTFIQIENKQTIKINQNTIIFITINPGYAGRRELPTTLTQLTRYIAVNKPDLTDIAEVMLASHGFQTAKVLSNKIVLFFKMCAEQMSSQSHYDYGLRAIKGVLNISGKLLKQETEINNTTEQNCIIEALMASVLPKLVKKDNKCFYQLLADIFQQDNVEQKSEDIFNKMIDEVVEEKQLKCNQQYKIKINQILRCQDINCGLMLVGQTGSTKSTAFDIFETALQRASEQKYGPNKKYVFKQVLCPKAFVTKEELYGSLDQTTREWQDGQFTIILRQYLAQISEIPIEQRNQYNFYIYFDSYSDPDYIESLNSVLDDNRCLTLPNGERLSVPSNVHIIFEFEDLSTATPATVSRCSMIWFEDLISLQDKVASYVDQIVQTKLNIQENKVNQQFIIRCSEIIHKNSILQMASLYENQQFDFINDIYQQLLQNKILNNTFETYTLQRSLTTLQSIIKATQIDIQQYVQQKYQLYEQVIQEQTQFDYNNREQCLDLFQKMDINIEQLEQFCAKRFILALTWAFTAEVKNNYRFIITKLIEEKLRVVEQKSEFSKQLFQNLNTDYSNPKVDSKTIIQHNVDIQNGQWFHNSTKIQEQELEIQDVGNKVVETLDTITYNFLITCWLKCGYPLILGGPAGSGKSMSLMSALKQMPEYQMLFVSFSSNTTPNTLKQLIIRNCKKVYYQGSTILQPKASGTKIVINCDEINLPKPDAYGCQRTIEFIRHIQQYKQFFDYKTKTFYQLKDIQFVGTCNPPTDPGRYHMSQRFLSMAPIFLCDFPTYDSLIHIYSTFINPILVKYASDLVDQKQQLAQCMVDTYTNVSQTLTINKYQHYIYSPRELTRWSRALIAGLQPDQSYTINQLAQLLWHEGMRLFYDKIVSQQDKLWYYNMSKEIVEQIFGIQSCLLDKDNENQRFIYTFINPSQTYQQVNIENLRQELLKKEVQYFEESKLQNDNAEHLILADEFIETISQIDRVLKQDIGHLLLVAKPGWGKTSLTKFVAYLNNYRVVEIKTSNKFTLADFEDLLRDLIINSGVKQEKIVFIFDEQNALETTFLEYMNSLLASGEVPGLFEGDKKQLLISQAKDKMQRDDKVMAKYDDISELQEEQIQQWITANVQRNLHIVFSMNCFTNEQSSAASSPALFNRCVILWLGDWDIKTYYQYCVGKFSNKLQQLNQEDEEQILMQLDSIKYDEDNQLIYETILNSQIQPEIKAILLSHLKLQEIYKQIEYSQDSTLSSNMIFDFSSKFINPRLLQSNVNKLLQYEENSKKASSSVIERIQKGLKILIDTQYQVNNLQKILEEKDQAIQQAQIKSDETLSQMAQQKTIALERKKEAQELLKVIQQKQEQIAKEKEPIEKELAEAQPAIERAKESIQNIDKRKLDELKTLSKPPVMVEQGLKAVVLLTSEDANFKTLDWKTIQRTLRKPEFIKSILEFDLTKEIPQQTSDIIKSKFLNNKEITLEKVERASAAAGPMYQWVISVFKYKNVANMVQPLQDKVNLLQKEADQLQVKYQDSEKEIQQLESTINDLEQQYKQQFVIQQQLKIDKEQSINNSEAAIKLVNLLSGEKDRWQQICDHEEEKKQSKVGDEILMSSFSTYASLLPKQYRDKILNEFYNILQQIDIKYQQNQQIDTLLLDDEIEKNKWQTQANISDDEITMQNMSQMLTFSQQQNDKYKYLFTPVIIFNVQDQNQMIQQFKQLFGKTCLSTTTISQDFYQCLERALRFGQQIIVQIVDKYDSILNQVLDFAQQTGLQQNQSSTKKIQLNGKDLEASPGFKLIIILNDINSITLPQTVWSQCTCLNFALTKESFKSQLIQQMLQYEKPLICQQRNNIYKEQKVLDEKMHILENDLLTVLSSADQNTILQNKDLVNKLENIKHESEQIKQQHEQSEQLLNQLQEYANQYSSISMLLSQFYFTLQTIQHQNFDTIFDLQWYQLIIVSSMKQHLQIFTKPDTVDDNINERIQKFAKNFISDLFKYVGCTLSTDNRISLYISFMLQIIQKQEFLDLFSVQSVSQDDCQDICKPLLDGYRFNQYKSDDQIITKIQDEVTNMDQNITQYIIDLLQYWSGLQENKPMLDLNTQNLITLKVLSIICQVQPCAILDIIDCTIDNFFGQEGLSQQAQKVQIKQLLEVFQQLARPILLYTSAQCSIQSYFTELEQFGQIKYLSYGQSDCNLNNIKSLLSKQKDNQIIVIQNIHLAPSLFMQHLMQLCLTSLQQNNKQIIVLTGQKSQLIPQIVYSKSIRMYIESTTQFSIQLQKTYNLLCQKLNVGQQDSQLNKFLLKISTMFSVIQCRSEFVPTGTIQNYNYNDDDIEMIAKLIIQFYPDYNNTALSASMESKLYKYINDMCFKNKVVYDEDLQTQQIIKNEYLQADGLTNIEYNLFQDQQSVKDLQIEQLLDKLTQQQSSMKQIGLQEITTNSKRFKQSEKILNSLQTLCQQFLQSSQNDSSQQQDEDIDNIIQKYKQLTINFKSIQIKQQDQQQDNTLLQYLEKEIQTSQDCTEQINGDIEKVIKVLSHKAENNNYIADLIQKLNQRQIPKSWDVYVFSQRINEICDNVTNLYNNLSQGQNVENLKVNFKLWQPSSLITSLKQYYCKQLQTTLDNIIIIYGLKQLNDKSLLIENLQTQFCVIKDNQPQIANKLQGNQANVYMNFMTYQNLIESKLETKNYLSVFCDETKKKKLFDLTLLDGQSSDELQLNSACLII